MKVVGKGGFGKVRVLFCNCDIRLRIICRDIQFVQVNAVTKKTTDEIFAIKRINKREVLKKDPTLYTVTVEFDIMTRVQSPFCLHLICAFQTPTEICMVMPFMRGMSYHSLKLLAGLFVFDCAWLLRW
jgi:serine/threonine protein kinase